MGALGKKLSSRQGASILMALLFMLVCIMVGVSVLMAASSNAGKINSSKEEQQKYLTLSSALNLLVDEFEALEYVGSYDYKKKTVYRKIDGSETAPDDEDDEDIVEDSDGNPVIHHYIHTYTSEGVKLKSSSSWLSDLLPLDTNLSYIFAQNEIFEVPVNKKIPIDEYEYGEIDDRPGSIPGLTYTTSYTLKFTADESKKDTYGGLVDTVRITVQLDETTGIIILRASLEEDDSTYSTMEAVLKPVDDLGELFALNGSPGADGNHTTDTVRWELDHISRRWTD